MSSSYISTSKNKLKNSGSLRIAFIHPDLGIGGAERLVVDAAVGLSGLGHSVNIFTSSHHPERAFKETVDGTLSLQVLGNKLIPRSINNRFITLCAILRQIHLSLNLILSFLLPSSFPFSRQPFDIYFLDQLSASIPLLRYASRTPVLFYCHFPDLLLSPTRSPTSQSLSTWSSKLTSVYRIPLDWIEEFTTGNADVILVNSLFTAQVFKQTLRSIKKTPKCVYPGVDIGRYDSSLITRSKNSGASLEHPIDSTRPTILSINRFEAKKDLNLLLNAYIKVREQIQDEKTEEALPRLVFIGGYDSRLMDNVRTLESLESRVPGKYKQMRISAKSTCNSSSGSNRKKEEEEEEELDSVDVLFILNGSEEHKLKLLNAESTKMLAYTASNEHLGIGPLEGMACGLPVLAVDSGGPRETILDGVTGFLAPPDPDRWASLIRKILDLEDVDRQRIARAGKDRIVQHFSTRVMAEHLQDAIYEALRTNKSVDFWSEPPFLYGLFALFLPIFIAWWSYYQFF